MGDSLTNWIIKAIPTKRWSKHSHGILPILHQKSFGNPTTKVHFHNKKILIAIKSILKSAATKFTSPKVHNGLTTSNRGGSLPKILEQIPSTKTEQHLSFNRLTRASENIRTDDILQYVAQHRSTTARLRSRRCTTTTRPRFSVTGKLFSDVASAFWQARRAFFSPDRR